MDFELIKNQSYDKYKNKFDEYLNSTLNKSQNIYINYDEFGIDYYNSKTPIKAYFRKPKENSIFYTVLSKSSEEYTYFFGLARNIPYNHYYGVDQVSPNVSLKLNTKDEEESTLIFAKDKNTSIVSVLLRVDCQNLSDVQFAFLKDKNNIINFKSESMFINLGPMNNGSFDLISKLRNFISNVHIQKSDNVSLILDNVHVPSRYEENYNQEIQNKKIEDTIESSENEENNDDFNRRMEENFNSKFDSKILNDADNSFLEDKVVTKKCSVCGEEKSLDHYFVFEEDNKFKDTCRECINKFNAAKYLEKILQLDYLVPGEYFEDDEFLSKYPEMRNYLSTLKEEDLMSQDINQPSSSPKRTYFKKKEELDEFLCKYSTNIEYENHDKHIFCMICGEYIDSTYDNHPKYKKFVGNNPNKCANCIRSIIIAYLKNQLRGKFNTKSQLLESVKDKELMEKYLTFLEDNKIISIGEKLNFKKNEEYDLEDLHHFFNEIPKNFQLNFINADNLNQEKDVNKVTDDKIKSSDKNNNVESTEEYDEILKEIDNLMLESENVLNNSFKLLNDSLNNNFVWDLREELIDKAKKGEIKKNEVASYIDEKVRAVKKENYNREQIENENNLSKYEDVSQETLNETNSKIVNNNFKENSTITMRKSEANNIMSKTYLILEDNENHIFILEGVVNNYLLINLIKFITDFQKNEIPIHIESIISFLLNDEMTNFNIQFSINNNDFKLCGEDIIEDIENEGFIRNRLI